MKTSSIHFKIYGLLLLLLVFVLGLGYLGYRFFTQQQQDLLQQMSTVDRQLKVLQIRVQTLEYQEEQEPLKAQVTQLSKQQQQLEQMLTHLRQQMIQQPQYDEDWKLLEINYLLMIAYHQLQLIQDSAGALAALTLADQRLHRLNNPLFLSLRKQLFADIQQLRALQLPDIPGLAIRLAHYAEQVEDLPFLQGHLPSSKSSNPMHTAQTAPWSWQTQIWQELKQLITLRYNTEAEKGLLTIEQRDLITQTLSLKLETARLFLLRQDTPNFVAALQSIQDGLQRYYDLNDTKIQALQQDLVEMQQFTLEPLLPDITGTMTLWQQLFASRTRPAPREEEMGPFPPSSETVTP